MAGTHPSSLPSFIVLLQFLAHVYVNRCFVCSIASCCNDSSLPSTTVGLCVNASTIQASSLLFSVYLLVLDRPAVVHMHGISTNFVYVLSMYSRTLLCMSFVCLVVAFTSPRFLLIISMSGGVDDVSQTVHKSHELLVLGSASKELQRESSHCQ